MRLPLSLLLLMLACKGADDTGAVDTSDSAAAVDTAAQGSDVPVSIDALSVACEGDAIAVSLRTEGWVGRATLRLLGPQTETGWLWEESHPFPTTPVSYDPMGAWDAYAFTLLPVEEGAPYAAGESTQTPCDADLPVFTWAVDVYDTQGAAAACEAGGSAPESVTLTCE